MPVESAAFGGVPWTVLSWVATRALGLVTTLILARLLTPEDFGVFALATLVLVFTGVVSDAGLGAAVIVRPSPDSDTEGAVLGVTIAAGLATAAAVAIFAPAIGA